MKTCGHLIRNWFYLCNNEKIIVKYCTTYKISSKIMVSHVSVNIHIDYTKCIKILPLMELISMVGLREVN